MAELYLEHKKLTQELEDLERSSSYMKSILDDLHVEEVSLSYYRFFDPHHVPLPGQDEKRHENNKKVAEEGRTPV